MHKMNNKTDLLLEQLGQRIKQARLNTNQTQQEVADLIGKSRTAVERAEKGKSNMETFVSIMVALNLEEQLLNSFLPEPPPSPVALAKAVGNKRKRASGAHSSGQESVQEPSPKPETLGW